ncbi:DNA-damage-inducible protein J [Pseudomonas cedrina]|uniref:DNA-damage-inducible protein J n=2 Tax=Pseudomonas cedrina TaxID=651740 RepID=A0ABY0UG43_PSECE|nr:DNA-damage-inducible protein J [Pseudomonas cedrina]
MELVMHLNYILGKPRIGIATMASNALIQTRIDPDIKDRATAVLNHLGLTVSDAVRILLTRVANEGALPFGFTADPVAYDAWFRAKVQEALDDPRPAIPAENVEAHFAKRRANAQRKLSEGGDV